MSMNYKVKLRITNCDCQAGHPQAESTSWEQGFQGVADTPEEAEQAAVAKYQKLFPDCTIEVVDCEESPTKHGYPTNVFDPADLKKQDNTQKAQVREDSAGKGYD